MGDINSVNTIHNKVSVVCCWNNSKNLIPSDDFIDLAEYWLNRMWDTRSENFRSMDDVVDSDKCAPSVCPVLSGFFIEKPSRCHCCS